MLGVIAGGTSPRGRGRRAPRARAPQPRPRARAARRPRLRRLARRPRPPRVTAPASCPPVRTQQNIPTLPTLYAIPAKTIKTTSIPCTVLAWTKQNIPRLYTIPVQTTYARANQNTPISRPRVYTESKANQTRHRLFPISVRTSQTMSRPKLYTI